MASSWVILPLGDAAAAVITHLCHVPPSTRAHHKPDSVLFAKVIQLPEPDLISTLPPGEITSYS